MASSQRPVQGSFWLDGQQLTLHGLLRAAPPTQPVELLAQRYDWAEMRITALRSGEQLLIEWADPAGEQVLQLIAQQAGKGPRLRLVCPVTGEAVQDLYFREGRFASAKGLGFKPRAVEALGKQHKLQRAYRRLFGKDGKRAAQGYLRSEYINLLQSHSDLLSRQARDDVHQLLKSVSVAQRRRNPGIVNFSTASGLFSAEVIEFPYGRTFAEGAALDPDEALVKPVPLVAGGIKPAKDHCCIDAAVLREKGLLAEGPERHFALVWVHDGGPDLAFLCTTRFDDGSSTGSLAIRAVGRQKAEWAQVITLSREAAGESLGFVCPVTGERTEKLYLRAGWFASREAQRLRRPRRAARAAAMD